MKHYCIRDNKRYKKIELEIKHCDGCGLINGRCNMNRALSDNRNRIYNYGQK